MWQVVTSRGLDSIHQVQIKTNQAGSGDFIMSRSCDFGKRLLLPFSKGYDHQICTKYIRRDTNLFKLDSWISK